MEGMSRSEIEERQEQEKKWKKYGPSTYILSLSAGGWRSNMFRMPVRDRKTVLCLGDIIRVSKREIHTAVCFYKRRLMVKNDAVGADAPG